MVPFPMVSLSTAVTPFQCHLTYDHENIPLTIVLNSLPLNAVFLMKHSIVPFCCSPRHVLLSR